MYIVFVFSAGGWQPFSSGAAAAASAIAGLTSVPDPFIPGAISNRTLEHLTESMAMRPYRAIRAEQRNYGYTTR